MKTTKVTQRITLVWITGVTVISLCCGNAWGRNVLALDGSSDRAVASDTVHPAGSSLQTFTAEAWFYAQDNLTFILTDDAYDIILLYQSGASNNGVGISFRLWSSSSSVSINEFRDVTMNAWNHVAVMFDATTKDMTLAINGNIGSAGTYSRSDFYTDGDQDFAVGGVSMSSSSTFNGYIDEVRVSNVVRYTVDFTPALTLSSDAQTMCLYHFDEPVGSTSFSDSSSNGYTLTGVANAQIVSFGVTPPEILALNLSTGETMQISWSSVEDQVYNVYYSTNLSDGFSILQSGITATPPMNTLPDTVQGTSMKFWKVSVEE